MYNKEKAKEERKEWEDQKAGRTQFTAKKKMCIIGARNRDKQLTDKQMDKAVSRRRRGSTDQQEETGESACKIHNEERADANGETGIQDSAA